VTSSNEELFLVSDDFSRNVWFTPVIRLSCDVTIVDAELRSCWS